MNLILFRVYFSREFTLNKNKIIIQDINDQIIRLTIGLNNINLLTLDKDNLSDDYDIDLINNENTFLNNNNSTTN